MKDPFDEISNEFNVWKFEFPLRTKELLFNHCQSIFSPVIDYYNSLFKNEGGDNYKMRKRAYACRIFDPFFLKGRQNDLHILNDIADELQYFDYSNFSPAFLVLLKKEIPVVISHANQPFNWEDLKNSQQFQIRLQKRIKRNNLGPVDEALHWEIDPGEKARRIWEWWRSRFIVNTNSHLQTFEVVLRRIVLVQLSSCSIEKVFHGSSV